MNYTVEDQKEAPTALTYPVLMRSLKGGRRIVLFTSVDKGLPLKDTGFGPEEENWIDATDTSHWEPFVGTITVSK